MKNNFKYCCAVCVTYNPSQSLLNNVINATKTQVDKIYIIDNGSTKTDLNCYLNKNFLKVVLLNKNTGIAAGFNVGIRLAKKDGYKYVLLLDQDSIPSTDMIDRYLESLYNLSCRKVKIAAVGPRYKNIKNGNTSRFVRFNWFHFSYLGNEKSDELVRADFLISSGSFYDIDIFEKVGLFNEGLFIDHVDTEWCNRVIAKGYRFYGVRDVVMEHSLGEDGFKVWFFRWRYHPIHKPFRLYFIMRNSILMYRMQHASLKWVSGDIFRLLRLSILYSFFIRNRIENIKWLCKGFIDGLKGVTGGINMIK